MQGKSAIRQRWELVREHLNERQRRILAAAEAKVIGRGGVAQVAAATGLSRDTISAELQEFDTPHNEFMGGVVAALAGMVRRSGDGRKSTALKDPGLVPDLLTLMKPTTRDGPQPALRWSCKSLRVLADEIKRLEHNVSHVLAGTANAGATHMATNLALDQDLLDRAFRVSGEPALLGEPNKPCLGWRTQLTLN